MREQLSDPSLFEEFEELSTALQGGQRSPLGTSVPKLVITQEQLHNFLRYECKRAPGRDEPNPAYMDSPKNQD